MSHVVFKKNDDIYFSTLDSGQIEPNNLKWVIFYFDSKLILLFYIII